MTTRARFFTSAGALCSSRGPDAIIKMPDSFFISNLLFRLIPASYAFGMDLLGGTHLQKIDNRFAFVDGLHPKAHIVIGYYLLGIREPSVQRVIRPNNL